MSGGDNDIAIALHGLIVAASSVTDLLANGAKSVFEDEAPENEEHPFVVFNEMAGTARYALGSTRASDAYVYQVKGITEGRSAKPAAVIRDALEAVLSDGPLTIPDRKVIVFDKISNVRMTEPAGGKRYNHRGGLYRLETEPA